MGEYSDVGLVLYISCRMKIISLRITMEYFGKILCSALYAAGNGGFCILLHLLRESQDNRNIRRNTTLFVLSDCESLSKKITKKFVYPKPYPMGKSNPENYVIRVISVCFTIHEKSFAAILWQRDYLPSINLIDLYL